MGICGSKPTVTEEKPQKDDTQSEEKLDEAEAGTTTDKVLESENVVEIDPDEIGLIGKAGNIGLKHVFIFVFILKKDFLSCST